MPEAVYFEQPHLSDSFGQNTGPTTAKESGLWAGAGQESRKQLTSDLARMRSGELYPSQAEQEQRKAGGQQFIAQAAEAYDPSDRAALADPYNADTYAKAGQASSEAAAQHAVQVDQQGKAEELGREAQVRQDLHRQQDISRENLQFAYDVRKFEHDAGGDLASFIMNMVPV